MKNSEAGEVETSRFKIERLLTVLAAIAALALTTEVAAADDPVVIQVDSDAAEILARREGCLKCHSPVKDKEGPSFKKIAAKYKYKDKSDAEERLLKHLRSGELVKFPDGEEEEHRIIKSKDENAVMNLIRWVLAR